MTTNLSLSKIPDVVPYSTLPVERRLEIDRIIGELKKQDSTTLIYLGTEGQEKMITVASQLISEFSGAEESSKEISEIHQQMTELNVALAPRKKPTRFLERLLELTKPNDEKPIDTKEVETQIHLITNMIDQKNGDLLKRNIRYDDMVSALKNNVVSVTDYIIALKKYLEELERERDVVSCESDETLRALQLRELEHIIARIQKKLQMFQISRTKSMQDILQIRMIQQNNETLTDSLQTLKVVVLPILWTQCLVKTGMKETSDGLKLIDSVNAVTAKLIQSNLEETATLSARLGNGDGTQVLTTETLQEMNRQVIEMVRQSKETVGKAYIDLESAKTSLEEGEKAILEALKLTEGTE